MQTIPLEVSHGMAREVLCSTTGMIEHVLIETVVFTVVAVLLSLLFRYQHHWRSELLEYLVGGLLGGIIMTYLLCGVILQ